MRKPQFTSFSKAQQKGINLQGLFWCCTSLLRKSISQILHFQENFPIFSITWTFCSALLKAGWNVHIFFLEPQLSIINESHNHYIFMKIFLFSASPRHSTLLFQSRVECPDILFLTLNYQFLMIVTTITFSWKYSSFQHYLDILPCFTQSRVECPSFFLER